MFHQSYNFKTCLAYAQALPNFAVTSCNDDSPVCMKTQRFIISYNYFQTQDRRPELTIQVAEDYYINNFSGQDGFVLADGFYSKKIPEDDLDFQFSADTDGM